MLLTTEERRQGIGGSDVGAIMGANPYCSITKCYKEKVGDIPPPELNYAMEWGSILEDVVGRKYAEDNNIHFHGGSLVEETPDYPVSKGGVMYEPSTKRSSKHNWAYAHPDFYIVNKAKEITGIEIKTVGEGIYNKYWVVGEIPPWQYYQIVWYSMVTKINKWILVGFAPHLRSRTNPMFTHEIEVDLDTQLKVWERVDYFWNCVLDRTLPDIKNPSGEDIKLLYPESTAEVVPSNSDIDSKCDRLKDVKSQIKPLEEEEEVLKNQIKNYMGNCGILTNQEGNTIATYKSPKPRVTTNTKEMLEDLKELVGLHEYGKIEDTNTKSILSARRFLLK